jgi:hypothetical protein
MKFCPSVTPLSPHFIPGINANCRTGPDVQYDLLGVATPGQEIPIVGRNPAGDWYYVNIRDNLMCWIAGKTGETEDDTSNLPLVEFEPLKAKKDRPAVSGCGQYTGPRTCIAVPGCYWDTSSEQCMKK